MFSTDLRRKRQTTFPGGYSTLPSSHIHRKQVTTSWISNYWQLADKASLSYPTPNPLHQRGTTQKHLVNHSVSWSSSSADHTKEQSRQAEAWRLSVACISLDKQEGQVICALYATDGFLISKTIQIWKQKSLSNPKSRPVNNREWRAYY